MVRIPFRVLPISPIMNMQDLAALCGNETTEELQPTNPFSEERKVETPLTMALQVLQVDTTNILSLFYPFYDKIDRYTIYCT